MCTYFRHFCKNSAGVLQAKARPAHYDCPEISIGDFGSEAPDPSCIDSGTSPQSSKHAEGAPKMPKVLFILQRRKDITHDECLQHWIGPNHTAIVNRIPGLSRWVQNHVIGPPGESICDGVGELWFDSDEAMTSALNSPEMAAAVEDAKGFLDMDRTGLVIVEEKSIA